MTLEKVSYVVRRRAHYFVKHLMRYSPPSASLTALIYSLKQPPHFCHELLNFILDNYGSNQSLIPNLKDYALMLPTMNKQLFSMELKQDVLLIRLFI